MVSNLPSRNLALDDSLDIDHQVFEISKADTIAGYSVISRALGCQLNGCDKPNSKNAAFEQFFFMTAFDKNKRINKVRVLSYASDHGYEIASKSWLKQFEGGSNFKVGENIDGISGATISVKSITKGVNTQVRILNQTQN